MHGLPPGLADDVRVDGIHCLIFRNTIGVSEDQLKEFTASFK